MERLSTLSNKQKKQNLVLKPIVHFGKEDRVICPAESLNNHIVMKKFFILGRIETVENGVLHNMIMVIRVIIIMIMVICQLTNVPLSLSKSTDITMLCLCYLLCYYSSHRCGHDDMMNKKIFYEIQYIYI